MNSVSIVDNNAQAMSMTSKTDPMAMKSRSMHRNHSQSEAKDVTSSMHRQSLLKRITQHYPSREGVYKELIT